MMPSAPARKFHHVAVLMGGLSTERAVSMSSGAACADALERSGYRVTRLDVGHDIAVRLAEIKPDACFNALHGRWGEDGCIQGILEYMGLPYTHSGVLASSLSMHKGLAKHIMAAAGVPVAQDTIVSPAEAARVHAIPPPYVAKPIAEGSSVGVVIVPKDAPSPPADLIAGIPAPSNEIMVERYIAGRELTCGVIGDRVTAIIDIVPAEKLIFYDYEAKYAPGGSRHILPAEISGEICQQIQHYTLAAHRALGCRGVSRADFRYDDTVGGTGELICLEVNTQPGMT
ncbi:MAG: D-alanine--D-alanine ligase, partial [Hyphomicrobiaceae bacterium]